jgi:uncharacterized protein involved in exopolysaccharide biosynthesis
VQGTGAPAPGPVVPALALLLQERGRLLRAAAAAAVLTLGALVLLPRQWESSSLVMPRQPRSPAAMLGAYAGLASLLGADAGGAATPAFLADLSQSREVLLAVLTHRYRHTSGGTPVDGTLVELLKPWGRTPALRRDAALRRLSRDIRTSITLRSGLLRLTVRAPGDELARQVNQRLLAVLDSVNQARIRQQAAEERRFAEARVAEASQALAEAERDLLRFEEGNRAWRQFPATAIEYARRQREVTLRQTAYTGLAQAAQQARLDEVHEVPVLAVLERPSLPSRPVSRHLAVLVPVGGVAGALLWLVVVALRGGRPHTPS